MNMKRKIFVLFVIGLVGVFSSVEMAFAQQKEAPASEPTATPVDTPAVQAAVQEPSVQSVPVQPAAAPKQEKVPSQEAATTPVASATGAQAAAEQSAQAAPATEPATSQKPVEKSAENATSVEPKQSSLEKDLKQATTEEKPKEEFVAARETVGEEVELDDAKEKVVFAPKKKRDPTLSPDDYLLIEYREKQRLAAIEAEKQRKLDEERRKKEEAERLRQLELARIKDPAREVRNKIKVSGVIGQEVFIGNKIYTIGNTVYGARIISISPEEVVFSYKGHRFVRKIQL